MNDWQDESLSEVEAGASFHNDHHPGLLEGSDIETIEVET